MTDTRTPRMIYIADVRMPTEQAHGYQIAKMCEAFSENGIEVTLVVPDRRNTIVKDAYDFYGIRRNFKISRMPSLDLIGVIPRLGYWIQLAIFTASTAICFGFMSRKAVLIYTRFYYIAFIFQRMGFRVIYEAHGVPTKKEAFFRLLKGVPKIVTNSKGVANEFRERGFTHVLPLSNAIDPADFVSSKTKEELRIENGLPVDAKIALYAGYLYKWKGIDTLVSMAELLSDSDKARELIVIVVGGNDADLRKYRSVIAEKGLKNIDFVGNRERKDVPAFMKCADVLVLPNIAISEESVKYTSPIKMFEYMASGVPIVASDLPSLREVLNEENSVLVTPDDPAALIDGIRMILNDAGFARSIADRAFQDVTPRTWDNRARDILEFIGISGKKSDHRS